MKNIHFCVLVLAVCLELGFAVNVAGEQSHQYSIVIQTDKSEYDDCDTIYISGKIENFDSLPFDSNPNKTYLYLGILDRANNTAWNESPNIFRDIHRDGTFVGEIHGLNYWFPHNGEYTVLTAFHYPEDSTEDSMVLSTENSTSFFFKDNGICEPFSAEKMEKIKSEEGKKTKEALFALLTTGFPQKVESKCDLVYLMAKSFDAGNMGMLPLPDEDLEKLSNMQTDYFEQMSNKPWMKEQLKQEGTEKIIKLSTDSMMKTYSIDQELRPIVSDVYFLGQPNYEKSLGLILMNPEDYVSDLECGKRLRADHFDFLHTNYESFYGKTDAETLERSIDAEIAKVEGNNNSIDSISKESQINEIKCGTGTMEKNGQCVRDPNYKSGKPSLGGGCLIATATYGSELAPQVQQLRELRDNSLLQTASGTSFMSSFNHFYYSFSPQIADWERESPVFKEMVKITLTPMISSLSILNYVDMDSEVNVLGYGISLIILNVGMYFVTPAIVIHTIRKKF